MSAFDLTSPLLGHTVNKTTVFLATLAASLLCSSAVDAQRVDNSKLYASAKKFRDAVVKFEKTVVSVRGIERVDERTVDRFEESTRRVMVAARNPRQISRLGSEYRKMVPLQAKAEQAIFEKYTSNRRLLYDWEMVLWCQRLFEQEFAFHIENPRNCSRVQRRTIKPVLMTQSLSRALNTP